MAFQFRIALIRDAVVICGFIIAQILAGALESQAQPFEVIGLGEGGEEGESEGEGAKGKGAEEENQAQRAKRRGFEAGEVEFEANSAYQAGFPGDAEEATRFASELSVGRSVTDFLKIEGGVSLTKEKGGDLTASNVALEATVSPRQFHTKDFGVGLFLALEPSIDDDSTNEFVFGLVFEQKPSDGLQITVNTFLEDTFGQNAEEGLAFSYGWQVKREVNERFAVGLEGFGEIEDVFGSPPNLDDQEHRIGPVIFLDRTKDLGFEATLGVLAGITRETPDVAFKLNIEIPLGGNE